jgi:hypothetical protein
MHTLKTLALNKLASSVDNGLLDIDWMAVPDFFTDQIREKMIAYREQRPIYREVRQELNRRGYANVRWIDERVGPHHGFYFTSTTTTWCPKCALGEYQMFKRICDPVLLDLVSTRSRIYEERHDDSCNPNHLEVFAWNDWVGDFREGCRSYYEPPTVVLYNPVTDTYLSIEAAAKMDLSKVTFGEMRKIINK